MKFEHIQQWGKYILSVSISAAYPIIFLYSQNIDQLTFSAISSFLLSSLALSLMLFFLLSIITKNPDTVTLFVIMLIILFFSYGHLYHFLQQTGNVSIRHRDLLILWGVILIGTVVGLIWHKNFAHQIIEPLWIIAVILFMFPVINIIAFKLKNQDVSTLVSEQEDVFTSEPLAISKPPDIYYIVLDGYNREDILSQFYGFDNTEFIDGLRERGFYVADQSVANYPMTHLSLASSLNSTHLLYLSDQIDPLTQDRRIYFKMVKDNKMARTLRASGYEYWLFSQWNQWGAVADFNYQRHNVEFEDIYFDTTILLLLRDTNLRNVACSSVLMAENRLCVENSLELLLKDIEDVPDYKNPTFTYIHVLSPHPPYYFAPTNTNESQADSLKTGWQDRAGYVRETQELNIHILYLIDILIDQSNTPPIIIIQGDHGAASAFFEEDLDWRMPKDEILNKISDNALQERMTILNAYYVPDVIYEQLYPTVTPVNSFRFILNYLYDLNLPLLEDVSYFSSVDQPFVFDQLPDINSLEGD